MNDHVELSFVSCVSLTVYMTKNIKLTTILRRKETQKQIFFCVKSLNDLKADDE
jgi:hypothetical protein